MKTSSTSSASNTPDAPAREVSLVGLSAIQGQDHVVRFLRKAMVEGRLHHALLLEGPPGVGKAMCARALFAALNCLHPPAVGEPCGACNACHKMRRGNHPDWIQVGDQSGGLAEQIDALIGRVGHGPHEGAVQFVLIDPAEILGTPHARVAANRLLKTLEEPPGRTHFVLLANNAAALLPTLRSRLQRIRFFPLPDSVLKRIVQQRAPETNLSDQQIHWAEGSMQAVDTMLSNPAIFDSNQLQLQHFLQLATSGSAEKIIAFCGDKTWQDKASALQLLNLLSMHIAKEIHSPSEATTWSLCRVFHHVQEARTAIERATSSALALERLLFTCQPLLQNEGPKKR